MRHNGPSGKAFQLQSLRQHHDAQRELLSLRELREHVRWLVVAHVGTAAPGGPPDEARQGAYQGMPSPMPNRNKPRQLLAAEVITS